ncbi:MAG: tRNA (cytosine(32)/uridine(32)-2'-O)-methyltransferase TrmJ [Pseudomonadales bacterium]
MLENIRVVLIETSHPGNIGAVARAMKNMGLSQLYLVRPKRFPHEDAIYRAASALDILDNAVVVDELADALAGVKLVMGSSARERRIRWPLEFPATAARQAVEEAAQHPVAILFGREDRGLRNEELQACHIHINIPSNPDYSSLNIAMAVQVICYELRMAMLNQGQKQYVSPTEWDEPIADVAETERFYEHLEATLVKLDFLDPKAPRQLMTRLRRLFGRVRPDMMEINILRGILGAAEKAAGRSDGPQSDK